MPSIEWKWFYFKVVVDLLNGIITERKLSAYDTNEKFARENMEHLCSVKFSRSKVISIELLPE